MPDTVKKNCLVCNQNKDILGNDRSTNFSEDFFGQKKVILLLLDELSNVFIVRKLFGVSPELCAELLSTFGNPSTWELPICSSCQNIIKEAQFLYKRIQRLIDEFDELAIILRKKIIDSYEGNAEVFNVKRSGGRRSRNRVTARRSCKNSLGRDLPGPVSITEKLRCGVYEAKDNENKVNKPERSLGVAAVVRNVPIISLSKAEPVQEEQLQRKSEKLETTGTTEPDPDLLYTEEMPLHRKRTFKCPKCPICLATEYLLQAHTKRVHYGDKNPFNCHLCDRKFSRLPKLEKHLRFFHNAEFTEQYEGTESFSPETEDNRIEFCSEEQSQSTDELQEVLIKDVKTLPLPAAEIKSEVTEAEDFFDNFEDPIEFVIGPESVEDSDFEKDEESMTKRVLRTRKTKISKTDCAEEEGENENDKKNKSLKASDDEGDPSFEPESRRCRSHAVKKGCVNISRLRRNQRRRNISRRNRPPVRKETTLDENAAVRKAILFACLQCEMKFRNQYDLNYHVLRKHEGNSHPFACDLCNRRFSIVGRFLAHQKNTHGQQLDESLQKLYSDVRSLGDGVQDFRSGTGSEDCAKEPATTNSASITESESAEITMLKNLMKEEANISYPCTQCSKKFTNQLIVKGHVRRVHLGLKKGHECPICYRGFSTYEQLFCHSILHLKPGCFHPCTQPDCKRVFQTAIFRDAHVEGFHLGQTKPYLCTEPECLKRFTDRGSFYSHLKRKHLLSAVKNGHLIAFKSRQPGKKVNQLPRIFKCTKCQQRFPSKLSVQAHLRTFHKIVQLFTSKDVYSCTETGICKKQFPTREDLEKHISERHVDKIWPKREKVTVPPCSECGRQCPSRGSLHSHMKVHTREKDFMCELCSKTFVCQAYLRNHQSQMHYEELGITPHKCEECGQVYSSVRNLTHHVKKVHLKEYAFPCTMCPTGFMNLYQLTDHVRALHTKECPHKCPHCPKAFPKKGYLTNHMRLHTGVKPWKCTVCGKEFSDCPTFHRHKESHGTTVHKCSICSKEFKIRHAFRLHMKSHDRSNNSTNTRRSRKPRSRKPKTPNSETEDTASNEVTNTSEDANRELEMPQLEPQTSSSVILSGQSLPDIPVPAFPPNSGYFMPVIHDQMHQQSMAPTFPPSTTPSTAEDYRPQPQGSGTFPSFLFPNPMFL